MPAIHFSARAKTLLVWGVILLALGFLFLVRQIVTPFLWALITAVAPALFAQARQLMAETPVYAQQIETFLQTNHLQLGSRPITAREITAAVNSGMNDFLGGLSARAPELVR